MVVVTIMIGILFIVFLTLLYSLLSANHDEEENLRHLEWVRDEFRGDDDG